MARRDPSKTEAPTPKRKKDARKEGRVARSPEVYPWLAILVATVVLPGAIARVTDSLRDLLADAVGVAHRPFTTDLPALVGKALGAVFAGLAPALLAFTVVAVVSGLAQVGFLFSPHALRPKMSRLNPAQGLKRMFSIQGLWGAAAALLRITSILVVVYVMIEGLVARLVVGSMRSPAEALTDVAAASVTILRAVATVGLLIAVADWAIKRRNLSADLRMTKEEVKREMRESEGDPHVRARLRSMRMAMSRNRMLSEIGTADVVITNPTHLAVAVAYDRQRGAPRVVARGADAMAARIRATAAAAQVPCVEAKPLARALYRVCRVGEEIPAELYQGVAVVLAFLHRLSAAHRAFATGPDGVALRLEVPDTWTPTGGELVRVPPAVRARERRRAHTATVRADRSGTGTVATVASGPRRGVR